ncbi:MAG TPA: inositol monophosphatase family protein [Actinomycetota bacterium]|nr:inositol monophosphatase family protein [Actinomycetota bacterium]
MSDVLDFAQHLAEVADRLSMGYFRRDPAARRKFDGTIVTEADEAVERALRTEISAAFPTHAVLGEEEGGPDTQDAPTWIVDPIDGTINFASGVPIWGTLIAHAVDGEVVAGVVSAPALGERYHAVRGGGAYRNGERIGVSAVDDLAEVYLSYGTWRHFEQFGWGGGFERAIRAVRTSRGLGDFWGHMLVASGAVDVMVEPVVAVWDLAPLIVIVEESGGRFTDLNGSRTIAGGSALSTNGRVHEEVLSLFRPNP